MNINMEKLNEYLKNEEILEFDSDKECMDFSTHMIIRTLNQ